MLEVQPGTSYDLSTSTLTGIFTGRTINLTQMSMPEFISKVDEINGKYDVVYIGNNISGAYTSRTYTSGKYTARGGEAPTALPQGGSNDGTGTSKEYYSDNDITIRRANTLKAFIESNQLTIFDQSILGTGSSLKGTKLNTEFSGYVTSHTNNFKTVDRGSLQSTLNTAFLVYNNANVAKRPVLTLNSHPVEYTGNDDSYQTDKTLGFNFDIASLSSANNMTAKLYIDFNGDGIFKALEDSDGTSELVTHLDNKNSDTGYTINYQLPGDCVGLEPWKLELTDNSTGAKSYLLGGTAFKATNSRDVLHVRLLQLEPTGNTLSINTLRNISGLNLLAKDMVYNIDVTEMSVSDFNNAYAQATPATVTAKVNGVTTTNVKTVLNGNYDMVIMGFADTYGGNDLTNTNALTALQSFIASKQSVMFTHDTLTFQVNSNPSWGYNITKNFRNIVGQQRYFRTAPDTTRYYDPMPNSSKDSYGFTNLTLARYNNGLKNDGTTFVTTTKTHKINDNLVTRFPFILGDIPVSATHFQYFQLDLEDENVVPVYTYTNDSGSFYRPGDGRNDYYTYSKGSITYSGTGHSQVNGLPEEKMFVNTMIKASRGANHAPTLVVNGISEGMNIANTLPSIGFNFTATDIDSYDQYLNADIYLSSSTDGSNFSNYQNVKHFSATDLDLTQRVSSGVAQSVSVPTVNSSIKAYKLKVVAYDGYNAQSSQEIKLICKPDPSISVPNFTASCLVGDSIDIPVNLTATATVLKETFRSIQLRSDRTKLAGDGTSIPIDTHISDEYTELAFRPEADTAWTSVWTDTPKSYHLTFGTLGDQSSEGTYNVSNKLTYTAYNGVPPISSNATGQVREIDQTFKVNVESGKITVEVHDSKGRGIKDVPLTISGTSFSGITGESGSYSFTGLSTGSYTVCVTVPTGRTINGALSQTVSLSAGVDEADYNKSIGFTMGGDLMQASSIKSTSGDSQMVISNYGPFYVEIGFNLLRPATILNIDLTNSLIGSSTSVEIKKVYRDNQEINFKPDDSNPGKLLPLGEGDSFLSGTYKVEAKVTSVGGVIKEGQSFEVSLTTLTSALDPSTGYEENITTAPAPLTVILSPKLY